MGHVYIMASKPNGTLYTGVTSDIQERVWEHKNDVYPRNFTSKYGCKRLVWFERHPNIVLAIKREKSIKDFKRAWKVEMIEALNPDWEDLFGQVYELDNPYVPHPSHPLAEAYADAV